MSWWIAFSSSICDNVSSFEKEYLSSSNINGYLCLFRIALRPSHHEGQSEAECMASSGQASKLSKWSESHAPCNNPWHLRPAPRTSYDLPLANVLSCCAHYCHNIHLQIIHLSISMFLNDILIDVVTSHGKQLVVVEVSLLRLDQPFPRCTHRC